MIVSVEYSYEPSQPFMCVPACINMILRRRDFNSYDQLELGNRLGLIVPENLSSKYPGMRTSDDMNQWGIPSYNLETSLNKLFSSLDLNLYHRYFPVHYIPANNFIDFISENIELGNDIMIGFDYLSVYNNGEHVGHTSLISKADSIQNLIWLTDPEYIPENDRPIRCEKLIHGMEVKNDGIWIFTDKERPRIPQPF